MGFSFFQASKPPRTSGGSFFWGGFGRYWGDQNWDCIFEKTRVGFGRTELSLMLSCTECCALSSGHGPRDLDFQGFCSAKSLQNVQKKSRKAIEIIEQSTENLLKPKNTNGF